MVLHTVTFQMVKREKAGEIYITYNKDIQALCSSTLKEDRTNTDGPNTSGLNIRKHSPLNNRMLPQQLLQLLMMACATHPSLDIKIKDAFMCVPEARSFLQVEALCLPVNTV